MTASVVLEKDGVQHEVVVRKATISEANETQVHLEGTDPYCFPEEIREGLNFYSKGPSTFIGSEDDVEVVSITPSNEPVSLPKTNF